MNFRDEDIAEAFAESTGGRREYFGADGYSFRRLAKLRDADFEKKLNVLRATAWNREHPEARAEIAKTYWSRPEVKARAAKQARDRRALKKRPVLTCKECGAKFMKRGRAGGTVPEFCRNACRERFRYHRKRGGRRIGPRLIDPAARAERRRHMKREWARAKARQA